MGFLGLLFFGSSVSKTACEEDTSTVSLPVKCRDLFATLNFRSNSNSCNIFEFDEDTNAILIPERFVFASFQRNRIKKQQRPNELEELESNVEIFGM